MFWSHMGINKGTGHIYNLGSTQSQRPNRIWRINQILEIYWQIDQSSFVLLSLRHCSVKNHSLHKKKGPVWKDSNFWKYPLIWKVSGYFTSSSAQLWPNLPVMFCNEKGFVEFAPFSYSGNNEKKGYSQFIAEAGIVTETTKPFQ